MDCFLPLSSGSPSACTSRIIWVGIGQDHFRVLDFRVGAADLAAFRCMWARIIANEDEVGTGVGCRLWMGQGLTHVSNSE